MVNTILRGILNVNIVENFLQMELLVGNVSLILFILRAHYVAVMVWRDVEYVAVMGKCLVLHKYLVPVVVVMAEYHHLALAHLVVVQVLENIVIPSLNHTYYTPIKT